MKVWFIRHNNESLGPYTIEELQNLSMTKDDYVWKEGLADWVQAKSVPELNGLFTVSAPPPFAAQNESKSESSFTNQSPDHHSYNLSHAKQGKTRRPLIWISLVLIGSFIGYLIYANNHSTDASPFDMSSQKSPEQIKAELVQSEKENPGQFISGRARNRKNLIGETVIEGTLDNTATIAVFKDIVLQVDFLSKTNSVIASKNFTVYEIIQPGQTINFKEKAFVGKDVRDVQVSIIGATSAN
jgi:hypothetical protein